jgi:hypothetical protein
MAFFSCSGMGASSFSEKSEKNFVAERRFMEKMQLKCIIIAKQIENSVKSKIYRNKFDKNEKTV